ncbi:hypothetical protein KC320_g3595 [Hortaea werneckii]|nr:hypothetical protein KC320_g3595 [Hortaea werneckii]
MMTTETPRLDTIATELLSTILTFIDDPEGTCGTYEGVNWSDRLRNLHAVTATSKQLRLVTLPVLYRRFRPFLQSGNASLALFTRSLCENPDLMKHVQQLDIAAFEEEHFQVSSPQDTHILKANLLRLRFLDHYDDIEASLEKNCSTALNLLLLSLFTKLIVVNIGFGTDTDPPQEPLGLRIGLLKVDDVFLLEGDTWATVDLALPPNLHTLEIYVDLSSESSFGEIWGAVGRTRHPELIDLTLSLWVESEQVAQEGLSETSPDLTSKEFIGVDKGTREELYKWRYDKWSDDIAGDFNMRFTGKELWRMLCFLEQQFEEQGGTDFLVENQESVIYVS